MQLTRVSHIEQCVPRAHGRVKLERIGRALGREYEAREENAEIWRDLDVVGMDGDMVRFCRGAAEFLLLRNEQHL